MAKINFITSNRSRMMKTPICINLANKIGAPIIDADFGGTYWTRISRLVGSIVESSNKKDLSLKNGDFVELEFQNVQLCPMWVEIGDNEEKIESVSLPALLQRVYEPYQEQFRITYKKLPVWIKDGEFHVIKEDISQRTTHFNEIFVDCPGAEIRFDKKSFFDQLKEIRSNLRNARISLYHVIDYNLVRNKMQSIPGNKMQSIPGKEKIPIAKRILQEKYFLTDTIVGIINDELSEEIIPLIDGISLIVNFFEFKKGLSGFINTRVGSQKRKIISISSGPRTETIYGRGNKIREVYILHECSDFLQWPGSKCENVYRFLLKSKTLENLLEKVGDDQNDGF